ncbi:MAG TPA: histidine kinase, partial [Fimbriimonadaceae bacterium]|nr:histidine kinase [Fimbriimonadaceae bacterium]
MRSSPSRVRHLIFMAHMGLCAPFLFVWLYNPAVRNKIPDEAFERLYGFIVLVMIYLAVRTVLAFKDPKWLNWELVFPPIDVAIISGLIYLGDREPMSNVSLLYLIPVAEAAGTLSVAWAAGVGAMVFAGAAAASQGFLTKDPFSTVFRYFLLGIIGSLLASLAQAQAWLREQLGVARDRNRIAMEMHDGVQGHLVTIASQLELAQHLAERDPTRTAEIAGESREAARLAADELRFLVQRLRSPELREGFLPALKQFAHNQATRSGIGLDFQVQGEPFDLDAERENAVFRIAQEALNNVVRHARATAVNVSIEFHAQRLTLQIEDNGMGFEGPP